MNVFLLPFFSLFVDKPLVEKTGPADFAFSSETVERAAILDPLG